MSEIIVDLAYVGSTSKDLLRQVQINALPFGATFQPQNQDPTRAPSAVLGSSALPNDFLRPYPGYGGIRMWDYSGYSNYHALQTSVTRRFDRGFSFNGFWVWSKALGINSTDFAAGVPNLTRCRNQTARLLVARLRPSAQHPPELDLPVAELHEQQGARPADQRVAALGGVSLDERPAVWRRLQHSRDQRRRT